MSGVRIGNSVACIGMVPCKGGHRIVADVSDSHADVRPLSNLGGGVGGIEHFADGQIEAIQLGPGRLPKGVQDVVL